MMSGRKPRYRTGSSMRVIAPPSPFLTSSARTFITCPGCRHAALVTQINAVCGSARWSATAPQEPDAITIQGVARGFRRRYRGCLPILNEHV